MDEALRSEQKGFRPRGLAPSECKLGTTAGNEHIGIGADFLKLFGGGGGLMDLKSL